MKMRPPARSSTKMMKKEFLKKWVLGLRMWSSSGSAKVVEDNNNNEIKSVLERKKAIKLSADVAIASTRSPSTLWSRALISSAVSDPQTCLLVEHITGSRDLMMIIPTYKRQRTRTRKRKKNTMMMMMMMKKKKKVNATSMTVARRMVKKRTEVLRRLVPGGEEMDECRLIREALDYIVSLRAQVDVMHHLATATHMFDHTHTQC